ncbi:biotin-dependent carboxyltransferase family protein [uncultured Tenacibaculum sp.]|uniref:5-oxoprolinase subunit C family protein n=1 Tax=uncultured Tenacibaculum sp. TaxID=174713 RepID=UPI00260ECD72|nr:biotin-dependent carboxyltransferase family protein [uncultured Tenacibaculum sp.]
MIKVLHSGFFTTIQDRGRFGYAHYGVPVSGAMDLYAHELANAILDNKNNEATVEITFGGAKFEFLEDCTICVTGADYEAKINGITLVLNKMLSAKKGDVLTFGKRKFGVRTYLGIKGGIEVKEVLHSKSFYKGITEQQVLNKGEVLTTNKQKNSISNTNTKISVDVNRFITPEIECLPGPEFGSLSKNQKKQLQDNIFTISGNNSRMGYFLEETIENSLSSMLSSGVLPGTIQLTPSGKLIILMRDCQVTGGYPRILQLTSASVSKLAQKTTNDTISFVL